MKRGAITLAICGILLVASLPFVLGHGDRIAAFLVDPTSPAPVSAPPSVRLDAPASGDGVGPVTRIVGEARAEAGRVVTDVQLRVDGGRWTSLPDITRGAPVVPFANDVDLSPGDHLLETRAWDGAAYSMARGILVRAANAAPPTVALVAPPDGAGVPSGVSSISGTLRNGDGATVELRVDGVPVAVEQVGASWTARVNLVPGVHVARAQAIGPVSSLPAAATFAAGARPPPTLTIVGPEDGAGFGSAGDAACPGPCILFHGAVVPGAPVNVSLDGGTPVAASVSGEAWTHRLSMDALLSGSHRVTFSTDSGVPRSVAFEVRTPRAINIEGDEAPRLSGTALAFHVGGLADASGASWRLDGVPAGEGPSVSLSLPTPGSHTLTLRAQDARGRPATAELPLLAINRAPVADFIAAGGLAVADIPFTARASDADGFVVRYAWQFGDGTAETTSSPNLTHRYRSEGVYRANLTVFDDQGLASAPHTLLVAVANAPPIASFEFGPPQPTLLDTLQFTDLSIDPEGHLASRSWDLGDGTTSSERSPTHRYATKGDHLVTLRVTDALGASAATSQTIHVRNLDPDARFAWSPLAPSAGEEVIFTDASRKLDGFVASQAWSFGHGASCPCNATSSPNATGAIVAHAFPHPGSFNVTLVVVDDAGASASVTHEIHVGDALPEIRAILARPATPRALEEVSFRALANDVLGDIANLSWNFGDGSVSGEAQPTHGYQRSGAYDVTARATSRAGREAVAKIVLDVANVPAVPQLSVRGNVSGYPVTLVADASRDPDGVIVRYHFDADGDGLPDCDGTEARCVFVYPAPGIYAANLTLVDDEGATSSIVVAVMVVAPPPGSAAPTVAAVTPSPHASLSGSVVLGGTASATRPLVAVEAQLRNATHALAAGNKPWMSAEGTSAWHLLLDTTAFPDGDYSLVVRARDAAGAEGFLFVPISLRNALSDHDIQLRVANAPLDSIGPEYAIEGSAYHPDGITAIRYRLDDDPWRDPTGPSHAFTIQLSGMRPGAHILLVDAYHGVDEKQEVRVLLQVADPPPALLVDDPPNPLAYGLIHAAGRLDGDGVVQWRLDTGLWEDVPAVGGEWKLDAATREFPSGRHLVAFKSVGPGGAEGASREFAVKVVRPVGDSRFAGYGIDPPTPPTRSTPGMGTLLVVAALAMATFGDVRRRL